MGHGLWAPRKENSQPDLPFPQAAFSKLNLSRPEAPEGMGWSSGAGEAPVTQAQT